MSSVVVKQSPVEEEYKKTGVSPQDISKLREWLHTQPHLPGDHITDLDLILTFHCCERSAEVSKQVLDLHLTLKTLFTSYFKDRVVDEKIERVLKSLLVTPLPTPSKEGYRVFYVYFLENGLKYFNFADVLRTSLMVLDLTQYEEGTWPGCMILYDLEQMTLGHLAKLDLQNMQQFLYFLQEAVLLKLKGLHYLNAPPFMDKLLMLMKPFLDKKLLDLFRIHQARARTLDEFYPMRALPTGAVGGESKSLTELSNDVLAKLKANEEFFILENKKRVVEAKRPGRPKTISDIFGGVEGSFKKLDID